MLTSHVISGIILTMDRKTYLHNYYLTETKERRLEKLKKSIPSARRFCRVCGWQETFRGLRMTKVGEHEWVLCANCRILNKYKESDEFVAHRWESLLEGR